VKQPEMKSSKRKNLLAYYTVFKFSLFLIVKIKFKIIISRLYTIKTNKINKATKLLPFTIIMKEKSKENWI